MDKSLQGSSEVIVQTNLERKVERLIDDEERSLLNHRLNYSDIDASRVLLRKDTVWLGAVLIAFQGMDGFLTAIGINRFGTAAEGNPLLRIMMEHFGHIQVLTMVKIAAVALVIIMTLLANRLPWIRHAMFGVCGLYLFAAIIPWTYILFIQNS